MRYGFVVHIVADNYRARVFLQLYGAAVFVVGIIKNPTRGCPKGTIKSRLAADILRVSPICQGPKLTNNTKGPLTLRLRLRMVRWTQRLPVHSLLTATVSQFTRLETTSKPPPGHCQRPRTVCPSSLKVPLKKLSESLPPNQVQKVPSSSI